jgi:hypothetical protein
MSATFRRLASTRFCASHRGGVLSVRTQASTLFSRAVLSAVALLLPVHNAAACASVEKSFTLPTYIVAFIAVLILAIALTTVAWGIKQVFFRRVNDFTIFPLALIILGIVLGSLATFAIPHFESMFQSFGVDLPTPTAFMLRFRFLLWLPLFLTAIFYRQLCLQIAHLRYCLLCIMGETMLLLLVLMALYAPIFKLGCA